MRQITLSLLFCIAGLFVGPTSTWADTESLSFSDQKLFPADCRVSIECQTEAARSEVWLNLSESCYKKIRGGEVEIAKRIEEFGSRVLKNSKCKDLPVVYSSLQKTDHIRIERLLMQRVSNQGKGKKREQSVTMLFTPSEYDQP